MHTSICLDNLYPKGYHLLLSNRLTVDVHYISQLKLLFGHVTRYIFLDLFYCICTMCAPDTH